MQYRLRLTFSNLSFIGGGFARVTASAISVPILNACSFVAPSRSTNTLGRKCEAGQCIKIPFD
jgi:hypothetical protein